MSAPAAVAASSGRRVFRNTALLGAGNSVRLVVGFATTILITDELGTRYGLLLGAQRYVEFFRLIALFGLNALLIRGLAAGREDAGELLGSTIALRAILGVVFAAVALGAAVATGYMPEHRWLLGVFVVVSLGYVGVETLVAFCEGFERMDRTAPLPVSRSLLMLGGAATVVWLDGGLVGIALVFLGTQLFQLGLIVALSRSLWRRVRLRPRRARMGALFREGPRYMAIGLAYAALRTANIMILTRFSTPEEASMYGAALNFIDILFLLPLLSQRAFLPVFSREGRDSTEIGRNGVYAFSTLLMPCAVGLALLAEGAVALYPSGEFGAAAPVLRVLAVGIGFGCLTSVCSIFLTGRGRVGVILAAYAVALPVQLVLCLLWVEEFGAVGVALGTVAAQGVLCAGILLAASVLGLRMPGVAIARHLLSAAVMGCAIWPLRELFVVIPAAAGAGVYFAVLLAICPASSLERQLVARLLARRRSGDRRAPGGDSG